MASKRKSILSLRKLHDFHWTASSFVPMASNRTLLGLGLTPEYSVHQNSLNNVLYILQYCERCPRGVGIQSQLTYASRSL
jgi:hypothetical protein